MASDYQMTGDQNMGAIIVGCIAALGIAITTGVTLFQIRNIEANPTQVIKLKVEVERP